MNMRAMLVLTCLCLLIVIPGVLLAKDINVTLTFGDGGLIWTPPGPYNYEVGDELVITNNTGFTILATITDEDGNDLDGDELGDGQQRSLPLDTGLEAWVCIEIENKALGIKSSSEECMEMDLVKKLPTTGEWGLLILTLLLMAAGVVTLVRRRQA